MQRTEIRHILKDSDFNMSSDLYANLQDITLSAQCFFSVALESRLKKISSSISSIITLHVNDI